MPEETSRVDEKELREKVRGLFSSTVPRYYEHTLSVVEKMRALIKDVEDPVERDVLMCAAYLHDIGYSAPHGGGYVGDVGDQILKERLHSEEGRKLAGQLLENSGLSRESIREVCYLVSVHHRQDIDNPRLRILIEADRPPYEVRG